MIYSEFSSLLRIIFNNTDFFVFKQTQENEKENEGKSELKIFYSEHLLKSKLSMFQHM